eukprot:Filipodium_phascolosomae@DN4528_c0_g1_i1.p1
MRNMFCCQCDPKVEKKYQLSFGPPSKLQESKSSYQSSGRSQGHNDDLTEVKEFTADALLGVDVFTVTADGRMQKVKYYLDPTFTNFRVETKGQNPRIYKQFDVKNIKAIHSWDSCPYTQKVLQSHPFNISRDAKNRFVSIEYVDARGRTDFCVLVEESMQLPEDQTERERFITSMRILSQDEIDVNIVMLAPKSEESSLK